MALIGHIFTIHASPRAPVDKVSGISVLVLFFNIKQSIICAVSMSQGKSP